jgi:NACalpha-BTF3-like transcription factor
MAAPEPGSHDEFIKYVLQPRIDFCTKIINDFEDKGVFGGFRDDEEDVSSHGLSRFQFKNNKGEWETILINKDSETRVLKNPDMQRAFIDHVRRQRSQWESAKNPRIPAGDPHETLRILSSSSHRGNWNVDRRSVQVDFWQLLSEPQEEKDASEKDEEVKSDAKLVMGEAGVSFEDALRALKENKFDIVDAIMSFNNH